MEKFCTICGGLFNDSVDTCPTDHKRLVLNPRRFIGTTLASRYLVTKDHHLDDFLLVLFARDQRLTRDVVIKTLSVNPEQFPNRLATLQQEQAAYCRLDDNRFPRVYDSGELRPGWPFIVYEQLGGRRLEDIILDEAPLVPSRAAAIGVQIASALATAHRQGLVHGALSPSCVFITTDPAGLDHIRISDFGLTRITGMQPDLPAGRVVRRGRDEYTSPEQWRGERITAASDIYCLGLMLFEMLAARRPFDSGGRQELRSAVLTQRAPRLRERNPYLDVSGALEEAVAQMLSRHAEERPGDMVEVCHALAGSVSGGRESSGRTPTPTPEELLGYAASAMSEEDLGWLAGPLDQILPERPVFEVTGDEDGDPLADLADDALVPEESGPYPLKNSAAEDLVTEWPSWESDVEATEGQDEEREFPADELHSRPTDPFSRHHDSEAFGPGAPWGDVSLHFRDTDPGVPRRPPSATALAVYFRDTAQSEVTVEAAMAEIGGENAESAGGADDPPVWLVESAEEEAEDDDSQVDPVAIFRESDAQANLGSRHTPWAIAASVALFALASGAGAAWWLKSSPQPTTSGPPIAAVVQPAGERGSAPLQEPSQARGIAAQTSANPEGKRFPPAQRDAAVSHQRAVVGGMPGAPADPAAPNVATGDGLAVGQLEGGLSPAPAAALPSTEVKVEVNAPVDSGRTAPRDCEPDEDRRYRRAPDYRAATVATQDPAPKDLGVPPRSSSAAPEATHSAVIAAPRATPRTLAPSPSPRQAGPRASTSPVAVRTPASAETTARGGSSEGRSETLRRRLKSF